MTDDLPPGFPVGIDGSEVVFVSALGYFMLIVACALFFPFERKGWSQDLMVFESYYHS